MRLIDADALKDKSYETGRWMPVRVVNIEDIDAAPTVEAQPVRHGRWIYDVNAMDWGIGGFRCSECDSINKNLPSNNNIHVSWFVGSNYCPNCGAKMDLEVQDDG